MQKAAREAKTHTSWTDPRPAYEDALSGFIADALADPRFLADLEAFVAPLVEPGRINSLAQTLVKLTAPGVPDLYQGTELWTLTLVDPDNRAPVDYGLRRRLLDELEDAAPEDVWRRIDEGLPKLWTIRQALGFRRRRPELFGPGPRYRPPAFGRAVERARSVRGLRCTRSRPARFLAHVEIFVDGRVVLMPAGIGIAPPHIRRGAFVVSGRCDYPLRSRDSRCTRSRNAWRVMLSSWPTPLRRGATVPASASRGPTTSM